MAPRGYLKCSNCGKTYNKEVGATVNGKNYCDICKAKPLKDKQDRLDLIDYIWRLSGCESEHMPLVTTQIKWLHEEHGMKYTAIKATLEYVYEYSEDPPPYNSKSGIQYVVLNNYYSALKFFSDIRDIKRPEEEVKEILSMEPKEIVISRSDLIKEDLAFEEKKKKLGYQSMLDMDDIEDDGIISEDLDNWEVSENKKKGNPEEFDSNKEAQTFEGELDMDDIEDDFE